MLNVGIVVYPGFQPLGLVVGTVFEYANAVSDTPIYDFCLVSENGGTVPSSQGFAVSTSSVREKRFDTLIVLGDNTCAPQSEQLIAYLREAPGHTRRVTATCTGAFLLAAAGLLDGRRATTHWYFANSLEKTHPAVVVEEDRIFV